MTGWHYLLLVNIYLLLFYSFYVLLLRKETFFQLNRIYLVSASLLSFFIPLIQSDWVKNLFITREVQLTIYSSPLVVYQFQPIQHTQVTIGQVLAIIYLAGIIVLGLRFVWQMIILKKVINQPESPVPYSFFKKVKLGGDYADNHVIAAHENVHARQWHSADVLLIEAVMITNWFNPVVYLYRYSIKHIHEYIADRQALKAGTDKSDYALLLLSQTFNAPTHRLVNPFFNHSLLKQRIMMLQKNKSNRMALVKYGLSAPLFILMLILSSATVNNSKTINFVNKKVEQVFLEPASVNTVDSAFDDKKPEDVVITTTSKKVPEKPLLVREDPPVLKDTTPVSKGPVFTSVERVPEFPGGIGAFSKYLGKNVRYPAKMRDEGVQGRVIISFIVERDGELSDVRVVRGVADEIDKEALRVVLASPKWIPGTQNGKTVRVAYSVPINFALTEDKSPNTQENKIAEAGDNNQQKVTLATITAIVSKSDTNKRGNGVKIVGSSTNPPLYILDGKEVNDLTAINPNDIESISVLRDKSATALYGYKGANGVIIISSKKALTKPAVIKLQEVKH